MKSLISKRPFLIIIALILLVGLPALWSGWALVDDGKSAQISYFLTESIKKFDLTSFWNNLLEPESGRFRPTYWIYLWMTFLIGGNNVTLHYLIHLVVFVVDCWLIYKLTEISGYKKAGILAAVFFILDWRLLENWYRLGPQEPLQLLFLFGALYSFLLYRKKFGAKRLFYSFIFLTIGFFYKETSLAFVVIPSYFLFADLIKRNKKLLKIDIYYLLFSIFLSALVRTYPSVIYSQSGYSALYNVSLTSIVSNFKNYLFMLRSGYSPLLEFVLFIFLIRFISSLLHSGFKKSLESYFYQNLWLIWFSGFFILQLPWGFTLGRYLQVALPGLFIFIAIEISKFYAYLTGAMSDKKVIEKLDVYWFLGGLRMLLSFLLIITFAYQFIMSVNYIYWVLKVDNFNATCIWSIIKNTPNNGRVYLSADYINDPPLELYMEIDWHLDYLHNRRDVVYDYLPEDYQLKSGDLVLYHSAKPLFSIDDFEERNRVSLIDSKTTHINSITLTAPLGFIKELPKMLLDVSRENQSNNRILGNFYALSNYSYSWRIYKVN